MDPISNMLIMIKNASRASREVVTVPYSMLKEAIAKCLLKHGYLKEVAKKTIDRHSVLELHLAYDGEEPKVTDLKRISKPSRRIYMGTKEMRLVRSGFGMMVFSTPKGILSDKEAKKELVGGEALFSIW